MRRFIYNTQGTGISHEQIARLENTQPGPGTYLGGDMRALGDEIMLLDGLDGDEDALAGLGFVGSGNYRSRADYMEGFTLSASDIVAASSPAGRRSGRSFAPYGLGASPADRRRGRSFAPYGLAESEVSRAREAMMQHPDQFIGPSFYPLEESPADRRRGRSFAPYGLAGGAEDYADPLPPPGTWLDGFAEAGVRLMDLSGGAESYADPLPPPGTWFQGLGDAASDRRAALSIASGIRDTCRNLCNLINESTPQATERARTLCRTPCDAAYTAAEAAINAAIRSDATGTTTQAQQDLINEKLDALRRERENAERASGHTSDEVTGMSTTQMLLIAGGVAAVGLLAFIALRK